MLYDAGNIGETRVFTDREWSGSFKISIETPSYTTTTNAMTISVTCGTSSTTISAQSTLEATQSYQIHTGGYYNAPATYGYKPVFWYPAYQVTRSACPITGYTL